VGTDGNTFTLNLFRPSSPTGGVSRIQHTSIRLEDISPTTSPGVYRITTPNASYAVESGDFFTISYDTTQGDTKQFEILEIGFEDTSSLSNVNFADLFTSNFPLISIEMAGECSMFLAFTSA
jgi:hypothetical protein